MSDKTTDELIAEISDNLKALKERGDLNGYFLLMEQENKQDGAKPLNHIESDIEPGRLSSLCTQLMLSDYPGKLQYGTAMISGIVFGLAAGRRFQEINKSVTNGLKAYSDLDKKKIKLR